MCNIFRETTFVLFNQIETSEIREISHAEKRDTLRYKCYDTIRIALIGHNLTAQVGCLPVTALINRYLCFNLFLSLVIIESKATTIYMSPCFQKSIILQYLQEKQMYHVTNKQKHRITTAKKRLSVTNGI